MKLIEKSLFIIGGMSSLRFTYIYMLLPKKGESWPHSALSTGEGFNACSLVEKGTFCKEIPKISFSCGENGTPRGSGMRSQFILCFLLFFPLLSYTQCPTTAQFGPQWVDGGFSIAGTEVGTQCTGRPVRVTANANVSNARYIFNYKSRADTINATTLTSATYTQPGPYYIVQLGTVNGKPALFCNLVQVYGTTPPVFTLNSGCDATARITINTAGQIYGRYLIDWGDGRPPQVYTPGQPAPSYTYSTPGSYQIKVTGEGTFALQGCNADSPAQTFQANPAALSIGQAVATVTGNRWPSVTVALPSPSIQAKSYAFSGNGMNLIRAKNTLTDSSANATEQSFCYQVSYTDACNRVPMNNPTVCTIHLQAGEEQLQWSRQSPFVQSVQAYTVERLDANGQVLRTYIIGTGTQWTIDPNDPDQEVYYRVRAVSVTGQVSVSNIVKIVRGVQLLVPDVFSPNNDQINDRFEIKGQYIQQASVTVYDRWGNTIYHTDDWRKSWEGTSKEGQQLPNGVYTYYIEAVDVKQNAFVKKGAVYLVR